MPEPQNVANQLLTYQALNFTPQQQKNLMAAQQQQALAQALLQQGETPISTEGRSIGGVGYNISPWEGVAKLGQALSGNLGQQAANEKLVNALTPQDGSPSGSGLPDFYDKNGQLTPFGKLQILNNNRAVAEMKPPNEVRTAQYALGDQAPGVIGQQLQNQANPGSVAMQQEAGKAAAGLLPAGQMAPPAGPLPQLSPQPPIAPVQGSQALPAPSGMVPPSGGPLTDYRQQNGMMPPPVDAQRAASGLPIGTASPVPASQLAPGAPAPVGSFQAPNPAGMTNEGYKAALEVAKAAQAKQAETQAEGLGKAVVGAATVDSRFGNAQNLISQARDSAKNASYGMGTSLKEEYHNQMDDPTSVANADYQNHMSQLLTQAIPGIVQSTGGRIDIPLLNAIKAAENADISLSPSAKDKVLDDLSQALDQQRQNIHNQVKNLGGNSPIPSNNSAVTHIWTPQGIKPVGQ